jgi:hypothetical protein
MRSLALLLALALAACGSTTPQAGTGADVITYHKAELSEDDEPPPKYHRSDLDDVLEAERAKVAAMSDEDRDNILVRKRFIETLELCKATGTNCPPRIDEPAWTFEADSDVDPKLETPLRFDVDSWRKVSTELHGRACACRTIGCIDTLEVAIQRLEVRPMPDVQSDDFAATEIVRARDCLARLRGRHALPRATTE